MKIKYLLALFLFCTTLAQAETRPWTTEEKYWAVAATVMMAGDWLTTRNMTRRYNEGYQEMNPVLGRHPTTQQVNRHFAISLPLMFLIADQWQSQRKNILIAVTIVETAAVVNNVSIGLKIQY